MGLFGNGRAFKSEQTTAVQKTKESETFTEKRMELGGAVINKKSTGINWEFKVVAFHWLNLSLAGLLLREEESLSSWAGVVKVASVCKCLPVGFAIGNKW